MVDVKPRFTAACCLILLIIYFLINIFASFILVRNIFLQKQCFNIRGRFACFPQIYLGFF